MIIDYIGVGGLPVVARYWTWNGSGTGSGTGTGTGIGRRGGQRLTGQTDAKMDSRSPVHHKAQRSPCRRRRSCEIGSQAWRCWASALAGQGKETGKEKETGKLGGAGGGRGGQGQKVRNGKAKVRS